MPMSIRLSTLLTVLQMEGSLEGRYEPPISVALAIFLYALGVGMAGLYGLGAWALSRVIGPFIPIVIWALSTVLTWLFIMSLRHGGSR